MTNRSQNYRRRSARTAEAPSHQSEANRPQAQKQKRGPDMIAYSVREYGDGKAAWDRIGAYFDHKDGRGGEVVVHAMPLNGRITLREPRQDNDKEPADNGGQSYEMDFEPQG